MDAKERWGEIPFFCGHVVKVQTWNGMVQARVQEAQFSMSVNSHLWHWFYKAHSVVW